ncbi:MULTISPECIES: hypothetical protein [unclassified Bacillus cereus group]|uniref:hypothetical protein n=1 Tax=unclassified Bacillus cereus group TaxID=2750818 RepID=UPI001F579C62|nr:MULTISPECIES: hypothetical protein [unclassified Bacillus cereus group]
MMYLNINYQNATFADYSRLLRMYHFANDKDKCRIKVRMYILDKLIKKGEKIG